MLKKLFSASAIVLLSLNSYGQDVKKESETIKWIDYIKNNTSTFDVSYI